MHVRNLKRCIPQPWSRVTRELLCPFCNVDPFVLCGFALVTSNNHLSARSCSFAGYAGNRDWQWRDGPVEGRLKGPARSGEESGEIQGPPSPILYSSPYALPVLSIFQYLLWQHDVRQYSLNRLQVKGVNTANSRRRPASRKLRLSGTGCRYLQRKYYRSLGRRAVIETDRDSNDSKRHGRMDSRKRPEQSALFCFPKETR